ncbi:MAG: hypothetical protein ACI8P9_004358 [Parasphingorhabdus sp.]|jgi:hypothetical protein
MLSYIYRLCKEFELAMGYRPNVLFINQDHLESLRQSFSEDMDFSEVRGKLGLEVLLRQESIHPSVNWLVSATRQAV